MHEFVCSAETDDTTPVEYSWEFNDRPVQLKDGKVEIDDIIESNKSVLRLITGNEPSEGLRSLAGKYTCVATNGYSQDRRSAQLTLAPPSPTPTPQPSRKWKLEATSDVCV